MIQPKAFKLTSAALAVLTISHQAQAQVSAPAENKELASEIQQVVVTGSATNGVRKLDASYSITTASEEQLRQAAPSSTADLMKIVPGVFAEPTGGVAGANIGVRGFPSGGDAPFVTVQMNGSPLYPAPTLSFLENSSLFRIDDTIERVEVLRGGPSTVFSNGQPGATMNFILKKGGDDPEGSIRLTTGTGNLRRIDAVYSGKIAQGWYGMIGGFHRTSHGVRDTQFPADNGGQVTASITRKLADGEFTVYGRATSDKNAFFTGVPLISATSSGAQPTPFPGFDPLTGVLAGNELRNVVLEVGPNRFINKDLANGRGLHNHVIGSEFQQRIEGWNVTNKMSYMSGRAPTLAIFTGEAPLTMANYIARAVGIANGQANVVAAAGGRLATTGSAVFVNGGGSVPASDQVLSAGIWSVEKNLKSFTDELRVNKEVVKGHTVTAGMYFADFSTDDQWYLGNNVLMTAQHNARPINVTLDNGVIVAGNGGHDGGTNNGLTEKFNGQNTAGYLADEWKVNDLLTVDAGVRYEKQRIDGSFAGLVRRDTDNNPLTLYNNSTSQLSGSFTPVHRVDNAWSYTAGAGYKLTPTFNVFGRINSGGTFPQFDTLRSLGALAPLVKIKQFELGFKTIGSLYSAYITAFHTDFTGLPVTQILASGQQIAALAGSRGNGLEFDVALRPVQNLQVALTGNYQDSKYSDFPAGSVAGTNGNRVQRQPKFQARLSPTYRVPASFGILKLYATYTYIGERFSDTQNLQILPRYKTLDAGLLVSLDDKLDIRVSGSNLTNEFGMTEGNARIIGTGGSDVVFGRPIFGRNYEVSLNYNF